MIAVERRGGLGNQMFQYAFGLAAARRLRTGFVMPTDELARLFVLRDAMRARLRGVRYRLAKLPIVKIANDDFERPEDVLEALRDRVQYAGFFQSERFFADVADEVRAAFRLRAEHVRRFEERFADLLRAPYVCCHVRRTGYATFHGGVMLPESYYEEALARLELAPGTPVVFIGDELDPLRNVFGARDGVRFEENDVATDLQLLARASAAVVSNSTFAWWGGWLGEAPGRTVVAPRDWLGFKEQREYPPGVVPDRWLRLAL